MRQSIVLLITLALIVAISSLIAISLNIIDSAVKETQKKHSLIQTSIFVDNITKILAKKSGDINSTDGLDLLISLPIELDTKEIKASIEFDSAAKGLNPNNFLIKKNNKTTINPDYVLLFDRILQSKNVQNKELFIAMIEDTLDNDLEERIPGSEITLYDKRFAQGSIENYKKFAMIIDHYVRLSEDPNIYKIPWKKILSFYSKSIDFNYIEPELLSYILPYLDSETIINLTTKKKNIFHNWKDLPLASEYKKILKKYHISFYAPVVEGKLTIEQAGEQSFARFIYDIKEKKVKDIAYKIP